MRSFDELPTAQAIVSYQHRLETKGVHAVQVTDLDLAIDVLAEMGALTNDIEAGGPYVTRWLDPRKNVLSSETSFWIFLFDTDGKVIGKLGNRYDEIGRDSFYKFAARSLGALHPDDPETAPFTRFPAIAHEISGNLAYCGDLFIDQDWRHQRLVPDLIKLNYWIVASKWAEMDWAVNYVRATHGIQYSWTDQHWMMFPETVDFSYPPSSPFRGHWFGCATREMFADLIAEEETQLRKEFLRCALQAPDLPVCGSVRQREPRHSGQRHRHQENRSAAGM